MATAASRVSGLMQPLDWVHSAMWAARDVAPSAYEMTGLSCAVQKADLMPGDHVYMWKLGYAYNHHGIVVHVENCARTCRHDTLRCCSIVHFRAPSGDDPGRIELVPMAEFVQGRELCRVRYEVSQTEFYVRRSGCCTTMAADIWPLVVFRALSLLEVDGVDTSDTNAAKVEYDMLMKNAELLARWCRLGDASGVRRFRSSETAWSLQTSPGRFVRLGIATAAVAAAGIAVAAASGAASSGAAAAAAASSAPHAAASAASAPTAAEAAAGVAAAATARGSVAGCMAGVASSAMTSVAADALAAGALAASAAAKALLRDAARRPRRAADVLTQAAQVVQPAVWPSVVGGLRAEEELREYERRQNEGAVAATRGLFLTLGLMMPKALQPLLDSPAPCCSLCEVLVDFLEQDKPIVPPECAALVQQFLDSLSD